MFSLKKIGFKFEQFNLSPNRKSSFKKILISIAAIVFAMLISIAIATITANNGNAFFGIIKEVFIYPFKNKENINSTFSNVGIFAIAAFSFLFAFKAGIFNIGISGQMFFAATVGVLIGQNMGGVPSVMGQIILLVICMGVGAAISTFTILLKIYFKAHEVVTSIMLNWIIYFVGTWMLTEYGTLDPSSGIYTNPLGKNLILESGGQSYLPIVILTILLTALTWFIFKYTVLGKKIVDTGLSETASKYSGFSVAKTQITAMAISGAMAGVLAMMVYMGKNNGIPASIAAKTVPVEGFNGIAVGLIAMVNPIAVIPVSILFSMIDVAKANIQQIYAISPTLTDLIFGITIYGAAIINIFYFFKPWEWIIKIFYGKDKYKKRIKTQEKILDELDRHNELLIYLKKIYKKPSNEKNELVSEIEKLEINIDKISDSKIYHQAQTKIINNYLKNKQKIMGGKK